MQVGAGEPAGALDGAGADAEHRGDLGLAEAAEVAQEDHLGAVGVLGLQAREGGVEGEQVLAGQLGADLERERVGLDRLAAEVATAPPPPP